mmetsp:Transcript_10292/g.24231  ORF Transcript_10292/g.24231 Transcript_10292/m.24231 type:complete len:375 (+) Transcript_10292:158-1282(+)
MAVPDQKNQPTLPRLVHVFAVLGLRYPIGTAFLTLVECSLAFILIVWADLLTPLVGAAGCCLCGLCLMLIVAAGVRSWRSGILGELVDFLGEGEADLCFRTSAIEARVGVIPCLVVGLAPGGCYFLELHEGMDARPPWQRVTIYTLVAITTLDGATLGAVLSGQLSLIRLVAALLKRTVRKHFDHIAEAMTTEGLNRARLISMLHQHCKVMKKLFEQANAAITYCVFAAVICAYLVSLILMLQLVVALRAEESSLFMVLLFGAVSLLTTAIATALLHSITSVADYYEDVAAELSHNVDLRFRITDTFAGPAGVKLLTSFETEHVCELSFNFHHRPLDRRVLEGTLIKLFMGAITTIVVGVLTGKTGGGGKEDEA